MQYKYTRIHFNCGESIPLISHSILTHSHEISQPIHMKFYTHYYLVIYFNSLKCSLYKISKCHFFINPLKPWSTDDYLRDNYTPTIQSHPVLINSHETRSYRALKSQWDYMLERHLWVIIQKIVGYYQMICLLVMLFGDIWSQYLYCTPVVLTWQPIRPSAHAGDFEYIFLDQVWINL